MNEEQRMAPTESEDEVWVVADERAAVDEWLRALEAVLFVATEPLSSAMLAQLLDLDRGKIETLLGELAESYDRRGAGVALRNVAGGWRLSTHPAAAPIVERFVLSSRHTRLTRAALETLSIVAYKQPVTRHQVGAIRGVNSEAVLKALVDRGLVAEVGRDEGPGRPVLYGTTPEFLERLGLPSVGDLPSLAPLLGEDAEDEVPEPGTEATPSADPSDRG